MQLLDVNCHLLILAWIFSPGSVLYQLLFLKNTYILKFCWGKKTPLEENIVSSEEEGIVD